MILFSLVFHRERSCTLQHSQHSCIFRLCQRWIVRARIYPRVTYVVETNIRMSTRPTGCDGLYGLKMHAPACISVPAARCLTFSTCPLMRVVSRTDLIVLCFNHFSDHRGKCFRADTKIYTGVNWITAIESFRDVNIPYIA